MATNLTPLLNRVLRRLYEEKRWDAAHEPRLCHRLDTGTSGLVLLAKTAAAEEFLVNAIKERLIRKTYLCVTFGRPVPPAATLHSVFNERFCAWHCAHSGRAEIRCKRDHYRI